MLALTFRVGGSAYGVAVGRVVEVVPRVELRGLPHAPACLVGLLRYRGGAVPVVDLGLLMGASPCLDRLDTRIILVETVAGEGSRTGRLGMVADRVDDVRMLEESKRVADGDMIRQAPYLGAVYELDDGLLQLVEPGPILADASLSPVLGAGGVGD